MENILLIDKPTGITSFDVIRQLRKKLNIRKMGHAGTLDPLASGLMIIGVNAGTKRMEEFLKLPKVYYADILIGKKTTTGDLEGSVLEEKPVRESFKESEIEHVLKKVVGEHRFQVPLYSAIKVEGKPLYAYARAGQTPPRIPEKTMKVDAISLLDMYMRDHFLVIKVRVAVGSGTYIRVLGEYIGELLGYPATLAGLRRVSIGNFSLRDAHRIEDVLISDISPKI